jgi:uncharacterized protein YcfL
MRTHIYLVILAFLITGCASYRDISQAQLERQQQDHLTFLEGHGSVIR